VRCVVWKYRVTRVEKMANVHSVLVGTCERQRFRDLDVDGRIILKLRKLGVKGLQV
jgi:homoaconitase/3-isopropylmalate dehydratase large subunit